MYSQPFNNEIWGLLITGIVISVLAYGAFPFIYFALSPKVTFKSYRRRCFLVNFFIYLAFCLIDGTYNAAPYIIWTFFVTSILKGFHTFKTKEEVQSERDQKLAQKYKGKPQPGLKSTDAKNDE